MGRAPSYDSTKQAELERKVDDLEQKIRERVDVTSGFADPEAKARALERTFKFVDFRGAGLIDYNSFFSALCKFNMVGVQRESEALFNKFATPEDLFPYKEFSLHLWGLGKRVTLDHKSKDVLEKVKTGILERGGAIAIHSLSKMLRQLDTDGNRNADRTELEYTLKDFGVYASSSELQLLFDNYDKARCGKVNTDDLLVELMVS